MTLYQQYRPRGVIRAHGRLTEELWQRHLYHPDEDRGLSQILATLSPAIASARAKLPKDIGLKRKHQRNVLTDQTVVCKALAYGVAGVRRRSRPTSTWCPNRAGDVDVVNVRGAIPGVPTLVIGRKLFETDSDIELAFVVGRTLAAIRPDHLLRWPSFVPTLAELEIAVRAAIRLVDPERPIPADVTGEVEQYAGFLTPDVAAPGAGADLRAGEALRGRARRGSGAVGTVLPRWARAACLTTHPRRPAAGGRSRGRRSAWARRSRRRSASIPPTSCATSRPGARRRATPSCARPSASARSRCSGRIAARCERRERGCYGQAPQLAKHSVKSVEPEMQPTY